MFDNYDHKDVNVIYITESIPGPAENSPEYELLLGNYNSQILENCLCDKICNKMVCKCLNISHGDNYKRYRHNGKLKYRLNYKPNVSNDYPIIECNSNCTCSAECGNRIVQNGPIDGLFIKHCENQLKGLGLFTSHFIYKGTFICEYAGELLTKTQALVRSEENEAQGQMNYIFCLNEHTCDGVIQTFVDPSKFGNIGRYINHSCEPNCCVVPVRSDTAIPRLAIFASVDFVAGEEITFSYSSGSDNTSENTKTNHKKKNCLCNSKSCKGFMPFQNYN